MLLEAFFNHELSEWSGSIAFYLSDLDILQRRLLEVAAKNNKQPIIASIEHFQNQFILQKETLQILKHSVNDLKEKLQEEIKIHARINNLDLVDSQQLLRESIQLSEKIFIELKHSFYRFLAKVF